jgi:hypothetical protein
LRWRSAFPTKPVSHAHSGRQQVGRPANIAASLDRDNTIRHRLPSGRLFRC